MHVSDQGATIPVTFRDVATDRGIPQMFQRYTSGNRLPEDRKERPAEKRPTTPR